MQKKKPWSFITGEKENLITCLQKQNKTLRHTHTKKVLKYSTLYRLKEKE